MKKTIYLLFLAAAFGCSDDKEGEDICENKVWGVAEMADHYYITYGPTADDSGTIEVDEDTYDYYVDQGNTTDGSICYNGTN